MYTLEGDVKMSQDYNEIVQTAINLFLKGRGHLLKIDSSLQQATIQMSDSLEQITLPLSHFTIGG